MPFILFYQQAAGLLNDQLLQINAGGHACFRPEAFGQRAFRYMQPVRQGALHGFLR